MSLDQQRATGRLEWVGVWLEPLDVLFFRDGRPFGAAMRAQTGQPMPQTLAGAIWTGLLHMQGCDFQKLMQVYREKVRSAGIWEAKRAEGEPSGSLAANQQFRPAQDVGTGAVGPTAFGKLLQEAVLEAGGPEWIFQVQVRGPFWARCPEGKLTQMEVLTPMPANLYQTKKGKRADSRPGFWWAKPLSRHRRLPGWKPPGAGGPPAGAPGQPAHNPAQVERFPEASGGAAGTAGIGPGASVENGLRPVWVRSREDLEPATGFLTPAGLQCFLQESIPSPDQVVAHHELYDYDHRTGIGIDPDRLTSAESQIYAVSLLALKPYVGFYVEVLVPEEGRSSLEKLQCVRWGGEGRQAAVHRLDRPWSWPGIGAAQGDAGLFVAGGSGAGESPMPAAGPGAGDAGRESGGASSGGGQRPAAADGTPPGPTPTGQKKPFLLLITPGLFAAGWLPGCLRGRLAGAVVPGEWAVSGWDLARGGPKPTRFAAPPGSVYFLNEPVESLPESLSDRPEDRQQGWGCYLQGVWTDE